MKTLTLVLFTILLAGAPIIPTDTVAQTTTPPAQRPAHSGTSLYDIPPRWLVDIPTAGTLPRGYWDVVIRLSPHGAAIGYIDIGLSNRFQLGLSYGGTKVTSDDNPDWNPDMGINLKFRVVDELEFFPAISFGFSSQGTGLYDPDLKRYAFKSRGFYGVVSRSFYFLQWTAGGHFGMNYTLENDIDNESDINFFAGFDATFKYNLAFTAEYDAAINDDRSTLPDGDSPYLFAGKGRGYLSMAIKWLFTDNLELEFIAKDLALNRRQADTFAREVRITYLDRF